MLFHHHHGCRGDRPSRQAFSLVELLLSVVLLMLLLGAVAFNFSALQKGAAHDEGVTQMETLLRYAKAQAASSGKKVQVRFTESPSVTGSSNAAPDVTVQLLWEPDPLGQPGAFEILPGADALTESLADLVTIRDVQSLGLMGMPPGVGTGAASGVGPQPAGTSPAAGAVVAVATQEGGEATGSGTSPMPSIEFYPDGSCDSAQITVSSKDADDSRRTAIRLVGATGEMKRQAMPGSGDGVGTVSGERSDHAGID